jgi:hypothetical protein
MKRSFAVVAVLALAMPSAALAFGVIHATPSSVKPGHQVRLHGSVKCHNGDQVTLFSRAFKGSHHNFGGVPAVITTVHSDKYSVTFRIHKNVKKRTYQISGRCGGGLFGSGTLKVT